MNGIVLVALLVVEALGLDQNWRLVYPGRVEPVTGRLTLADVDLSELRAAWYWSSTTAPRRLEPSEIDGFAAPRDSGRLRLRVAAADGLDVPLRVLAAPAELWREVPESLLPTWPVPENGRIEIPWTQEQAWRTRVVRPNGLDGRATPELGSWWSALRPGQGSAALVPLAARDLRVEVVGEDGRAIPGARVEALEAERVRSRKSTYLAFATVDGRGAAILPSVPDFAELTLVVNADGHVPVTFQGLPSALPARVELARGARIHGRFVDGDREPVAGVEVRLEAWLAGDFAAYVARGGRSDGEGVFTMAGVPAGKAVVLAHKGGFAMRRAELEVGAEDLDLGELVLEPDSEIAVRVVDDVGEPIAGAELRPRPGMLATTDAEGRAVLRGIGAAQTVELTVDARGYKENERTLPPPHPSPVEVRLDRAFVVRGRFLDAEGRPVPEGRARARAGALGVHAAVTAGDLDLELPAGKAFELALASPATAELRLHLEPGLPGEERDLGDLVAGAGHRLEGLLVSAVDASPVAGARVWLPRPSADVHALEAWFCGDVVETVSAADGTFALSGLPGRDLRLTIDAPGFARRSLDVRPVPEAPATDLGAVELRPGSTLRVVAQDELPPGAVARVDLGNRWLETDMLSAPFADGVAVFRHLPPGEATVTAVAGDRLLCETKVRIGESEDEREAICRWKAMRVTGVVRVAGHRDGPGRLIFLPPAPEHPSFIERGESPRGLGRAKIYGAGRPQVDVEVGADGRFASDDLAPGAWTVSWFAAGGGASASREVAIPEVDELELVLDFPGRAVAGEVVDLDGRPAAGARVRDLASGTVALSEDDGSFLLLGLEPGRRWLRAERRDLRSAPVPVDLEEDRSPEPVRLVLGTEDDGGEIEVRIAGEAGGAFVFLEVEGRGLRVLTADASGRAALTFDPPYPPRLRAAAYVDGRFVFGGWRTFTEASEKPALLEAADATGALVISGDEPFVPGIVSATGWDLTELLTRLGLRPVVGEDDVRVDGLPPGSYEVSAPGGRRFVTVVAGEETAVAWP
jgi:hypothetical protein